MSVSKKIYKYFIRSNNESRYLVIKAFFYCAMVRFLMLFVKYKRYEKRLGKRGVESTEEMNVIRTNDNMDIINENEVAKKKMRMNNQSSGRK